MTTREDLDHEAQAVLDKVWELAYEGVSHDLALSVTNNAFYGGHHGQPFNSEALTDEMTKRWITGTLDRAVDILSGELDLPEEVSTM